MSHHTLVARVANPFMNLYPSNRGYSELALNFMKFYETRQWKSIIKEVKSQKPYFMIIWKPSFKVAYLCQNMISVWVPQACCVGVCVSRYWVIK